MTEVIQEDRGFINFSERDRADQHSIALQKREIGSYYQLGTAEPLAHAAPGALPSSHASTALDSA